MVKEFDPNDRHSRRGGQQRVGEKFSGRIYEAPEKIEFDRGRILTNDDQRLTVLAMLLENLGINRAVRLG